jgi:hypothetical protein
MGGDAMFVFEALGKVSSSISVFLSALLPVSII